MIIAIKAEYFPENCYECDFWEFLDTCPHCYGNCEIRKYRHKRHEDCPIVDLKDKRLIDANQFEVISYKGIPEGYEDSFDSGVMWLSEQIDKADTVI